MTEIKQIAVRDTKRGEPAFERLRAGHVIRDVGIEEIEQHAFVGQHVAFAPLGFHGLHLGADILVVRLERSTCIQFTAHQRFHDEYTPRFDRVDGLVAHAAFLNDHQAVHRDLFPGHHGATFARPVRVVVVFLEQVPALVLHPLGLDYRVDTAVGARGLDDLGRHQPLWLAAEQPGTGEDVEGARAHARVAVVLGVLHPDVAEQAGEQALVHTVVIAMSAAEFQAVFARLVTQLLVEVEPLQDALPVEEFAAAALAELVARNGLAQLAQVLPELQQRDEVGLAVGEAAMRLVRG